jgi:Pectate lyase superfamily protein
MMANIKPGFTFLFILALLFWDSYTGFSQKKSYDLVKDFGAKPDNKTDNYTAFNKAATLISKSGGGTLIIPKGTYYIAAYKIIGGDKKNDINDILFKNCKGLTVDGNNSTIRINGNFWRNKDFKPTGVPFYYAYNNSVCPFRLQNCQDVLIKNITLYGEVDKMRKQDSVVEGQSYGVDIADDEPGDMSSRIVLQNISAHHFAADGFVIKSNGENIVLNKCKSFNNARQGLSIVKGKDFKCLNSSFDSTGKTGAYGWHAPGAGIDVENEFGPGLLKNVLIQNCNLRGNNGFQIVTTLPSENVTIDSCFISDLTTGYSDGLNGVGMYSLNSTLSNCILFATIQVDLADQIYQGPVIQEFRNNLVYSGHRGIVTASFARACNITDNFFIMLPNPQIDTYFPYVQNPNCRFNGNFSVHYDRIKKGPNQVTSLMQGVVEASNDFWLVNGYDIAKDKRKKDFFYVGLELTKALKDQYFPQNDRIANLGFPFPQRQWLTDMQVDKILNTPFFSAYKQSTYNRKYLAQAKEVLKFSGTIIAAAKH